MTQRSFFRRLVALAVLVVFAASCAVNPVTGKKQLSFISEQGEVELGKETDQEIEQAFGFYEDVALNAYVGDVGNRMGPLTHRPQLKYFFQVLDTPVVNAFAVPGGYVYITRGAMAMMNSESELAVVLGHELGHVNARHSVRRLSEMMLVTVGLAIASTISETMATIAGLAGVGVQVLFLKYSRDDERQADALGVEYARKARFNPSPMVNFFASLQKMGDMSGAKHSLPGFLSTHPLTSERIKNVTAMLTDTDKSLPLGREPYLLKLDSLVYGEDPRQGYAENNAFYHPVLRFMFSIPADWKVQNTPRQVTIVSKDEQAAIVLQAEKTDQDLKAYASTQAEDIQSRTLLSDQSLFINGLSSYHQVYDIAQEDAATLRARLSFIRKGEWIYSFAALSASSAFTTYDTSFQSVVRSFKELNDPKYINRSPRRLKLVKATGAQTLQEIFAAAGVDKDTGPKLALLNGQELTDKPASGRWVKVIR